MNKNEIRLIHNREMLEEARNRCALYARKLRSEKISSYERSIYSAILYNEKQEMQEIKERIAKLERIVK